MPCEQFEQRDLATRLRDNRLCSHAAYISRAIDDLRDVRRGESYPSGEFCLRDLRRFTVFLDRMLFHLAESTLFLLIRNNQAGGLHYSGVWIRLDLTSTQRAVDEQQKRTGSQGSANVLGTTHKQGG